MPVIHLTKQAALALLQKWISEKTPLKIIFGLTDKTNAPECDGRLFTLNAAVIVRKAGSSTLLLEQAENGSITVSLETAVFEESVIGSGHALRIALNPHAEITLSESEFN
jgi:hypothetical protein